MTCRQHCVDRSNGQPHSWLYSLLPSLQQVFCVIIGTSSHIVQCEVSASSLLALMPLATFSLSSQFVRYRINLLKMFAYITAFQVSLDTLGMAIYGTELALWLGIFICGGYFNFIPWMKAFVSARRQRAEDASHGQIHRAGLEPITIHSSPSSTSVFRTPSSILVERGYGNAGQVGGIPLSAVQ